MKHISQFILFVLIISTYLFAQTIPHEHIQRRIDSKQFLPRQQLNVQSKGHLPQDEKKSFYQRPSPVDSLMPFPMMRSTIQKPITPSTATLPQSDLYVVDTAIVFTIEDTLRYLYEYGPSGKIKVEIMHGRSDNQWVNKRSSTGTYDADGNLVTYLQELWETNHWVNERRYTYTYDANGYRLSEMSEYWLNNQWVYDYRYSLVYNAHGNILTYISQYWSINQWVNDVRSTYMYDANGKPLTNLEERWENNQWVNDVRSAYTYDANGNPLTYLAEEWLNNQWVNHYRCFFTEDPIGYQWSVVYELWSNNQWVNWRRYISTYNANGSLLTSLGESWLHNQWENDFRYICTYDAFGNQLTYLFKLWSNNQWVNKWIYKYKYFQNSLWSEGQYEIWNSAAETELSGFFFLAISNGLSYGFEGYKVNLKYKFLITNVFKNDGIIVSEYSLSQNYPNPFNPSTTIRYTLPHNARVKLIIYDLLGREIETLVNEEQSAGWKEVEWNAKNISSGIYFFKLTTGIFVDIKKMIVVK